MLLLTFLARRLAAIAASLLVLSFLVFSMLYLSPGSVVATLLGSRQTTPEQVAAIRAEYHLDDPFLVQYARWLGAVLRGDLGRSIQTGEPVTSIVGPASAISLQLALYAVVLVAAVGIPLGLLTGKRAGTRLDRSVSLVTIAGMSAPPFAIGLLLTYLLGVKVKLFPVYGAGSGAVSRVEHLTIPAVTLAIGLAALLIRQTRASVAGVVAQDQVTFARLRGLSAARINARYILRNAAPPVINAAGLLLILALSATVLVESVFSLPGTGSLLVRSVNSHDIPLVQAVSLLLAAVILLVTLVVDVLAFVVDPRLRYAGRDR